MYLRLKTAAKIRSIRLHKEISVESLAKNVGLKKYELELIEEGRVNFTIDMLELLARFLYVDLKILINVDE